MRNRRTTRGWRPATIYLYVLITSTLVSVIGLAALIGVRVQRKAATLQSDGAQALSRRNAAIELGMLWLHDDPAWRSGSRAPWGHQIELGDTILTVVAVDPVDGDLSNNDTDPIYLVGTGTRGDASHTMAVGVMPSSGLGALEVSMFGNATLHVHAGQITSDQIVGSNGDIDAQDTGSGGDNTPSHFYADVEAGGVVIEAEAEFHGTITNNVPQREFPDPTTVVSTYEALATTLDPTDIQWTANSGFESAVSPWNTGGRTEFELERQNGGAPEGSWHLLVKNRDTAEDGPQQDLMRLPSSGDTLQLTMQMQVVATTNATAILDVTFGGGGTASVSQSSGPLGDYVWTPVTLDLTVPTGGRIIEARLTITTNTKDDFYVDDIVLARPGLALRGTLLSPTVNEFGITNPDGIFVIGCAGEDIVIEDCRIVGTLVILDPGGNSVIRGSIAWEPAIPNYPALIVDGDIDIETTADPLSEATLAINLNPADAPYPYNGGTTNSHTDDVLPSKITGIVYGTGKIRLKETPVFHGVVMANDELRVDTTNAVISYSNIHANDPPPAFDTRVRDVEIIAGTWVPIVN